ncbi:MAG: sigma-54-dependent transcriptional regulator [Myxococcota bacterium]
MSESEEIGWTPRVLVAEDDESMRSILEYNLTEEGFEVTLVARGDEAVERLPAAADEAPAEPPFDLVLTDVRMPGADGMEVLRAAKACHPDIQVVLVTAFGTVDDAVEALGRGAADYITKPFRRVELKARVRQVVERISLRRENRKLKNGGPQERPTLITQSPRMREVLRVVDRVAPADVTVLVTGESGTGKELIARRLHDAGERQGEFIPVNCAALPEQLLESELFGYERGAFTGATRGHAGKFERAHEGTLFLDEIAELPLALQAKLLRVLEEGVIDRLGGTRRIPVEVRLVAATHRDLAEEVEAGTFREDLFHRLSVIPVHLPPLRERPEDVPLLVRHFLREMGEPELRVAPRLLEVLQQRTWPGNVRELRNVVSRMVLLRRSSVLDLADLAPPGAVPSPDAAAPESVETEEATTVAGPPSPVLQPGEVELPEEGFNLPDLEREIILKALARHDSNQSATARYLGIPRHVLLYRLQKYQEEDA